MMIYVKNTYKPMRKSKKRVDKSRRPSKVKLVAVETHFNPVASGIIHRQTQYYPSLSSNTGSTAKPKRQEYTGTNMIGIATMHKSNLVPVFSGDSAKDISKMRRN